MPDPASPAAPTSASEAGRGEAGWRVAGRTAWRLVAIGAMIGVAGCDYVWRAESRRTLRGRAAWLQRACRRCLRVLRVEVKSVGSMPAGVYLTPNHVSYLDILVLAALTPVVFVSKHEVASWPVFGWFARRCGTRFLRRAERRDLVRVGRELAPVLAEGVNLAVFLEGTSGAGDAVLPFKPSLLAPAVAEGWPVVPVALRYRTAAGIDPRQAIAWWGDMALVPHLITLAGLPWVEATVRWGEPMVAEGDRKELAGRLQTAVAGLLETSAVSAGETALGKAGAVAESGTEG